MVPWSIKRVTMMMIRMQNCMKGKNHSHGEATRSRRVLDSPQGPPLPSSDHRHGEATPPPPPPSRASAPAARGF